VFRFRPARSVQYSGGLDTRLTGAGLAPRLSPVLAAAGAATGGNVRTEICSCDPLWRQYGSQNANVTTLSRYSGPRIAPHTLHAPTRYGRKNAGTDVAPRRCRYRPQGAGVALRESSRGGTHMTTVGRRRSGQPVVGSCRCSSGSEYAGSPSGGGVQIARSSPARGVAAAYGERGVAGERSRAGSTREYL